MALSTMTTKDAAFFLGLGSAWYVAGVVMLLEPYLSRSFLGTAVLMACGLLFGGLMIFSFFTVPAWPAIGVAFFVAKITKTEDSAINWTLSGIVFLAAVLSFSSTRANMVELKAFLDHLWGIQ